MPPVAPKSRPRIGLPSRVTPMTIDSRRSRKFLRSFASATMAMISDAAVITNPVRRPAPSFLLSNAIEIWRSARSFMSIVRGQLIRSGSRFRSLPWKRWASMSAASRFCAEAIA